jgi:hypothetical protein
MNREAELRRPSRVACSDLLGVEINLIFVDFMQMTYDILAGKRISNLIPGKSMHRVRIETKRAVRSESFGSPFSLVLASNFFHQL